ncbi:MAG: DEAD/DEAH box helicase [Oscillospiraceae bacterium]|nr:DEAD/DEAH box helicase [Oscillospiraceae bacterium]
MELYAWQRDCLEAWEANGSRGIVNAVTGAGKTVLALAAIDRLRRRFPNLRVKVLAPTIPLASQWSTVLRHYAPSEAWRPGFFGGGNRDDPEKLVMVYIVNSARDALAGHMRREIALGRHVLLICDECHHYTSPQNRRVFDFFDEAVEAGGLYACLGLSATPAAEGEGGGLLCRALGGEVYRYGFDAAARQGVIAPFLLGEVSASFLPEELLEYGRLSREIGTALGRLLSERPKLRKLEGREFMMEVQTLARQAGMDRSEAAADFLLKTYERKKLTNTAYARVCCGMAILECLPPSDRVLVFCERIEQARQMAEAARRRWGNAAGIYHSKLTREARARNLRDFRDRRTRILVSCRCLDEGLDVPDANVGIVLSGSAVERQRVQRLGRLIRASAEKDAAVLYYIYIRESTDDAAYLPGLRVSDTFALRYDSYDGSFSAELYEYAAAQLLERARSRGCTQAQLREMRRCLMEGLLRGDCLLPSEALERRVRACRGRHEENYWRVMRKLGGMFRGEA